MGFGAEAGGVGALAARCYHHSPALRAVKLRACERIGAAYAGTLWMRRAVQHTRLAATSSSINSVGRICAEFFSCHFTRSRSMSCAWKASATVPLSGRNDAAFSTDSSRLSIGRLLWLALRCGQSRYVHPAQLAPVGEDR